jgi:hypothetical protein
MKEELGPHKRAMKRRRGMAGLLAAARGEMAESPGQSRDPKTASNIARILLAGKYFSETLALLAKTNPEVGERYRKEHDAVAGPKKRAMTDPDLLDSRLD